MRRAVLILALFACAEPRPNRCLDERTVEVCGDEGCAPTACRLDHRCEDASCRPWTATRLEVDFDVDPDPFRAEGRIFTVRPGGFPRRFAEQIRFDFGDGVVGWGERVGHRYRASGVYLVRLEVRLRGFVLRSAERAVTIGAPASGLMLTVAGVPPLLNGSRPYESDNGTPSDPSDDYRAPFHLLVPTHGTDLEVSLLELEADPFESVRLFVGAEERPLLREGRRAFHAVPRDRPLPPGMLELRAEGRTRGGAVIIERLNVEATELDAKRDPFDTPMRWLFRFDMDHFAISSRREANGGLVLEVRDGGNGRPDFAEELEAIGALGMEALVERMIVEETHRFFDVAPNGEARGRIPLRIYRDRDPAAPRPADFSRDGDFSMMRLGGQMEGFGRSRFSVHNGPRVDDTSPELGIGTVRLTQLMLGVPGLAEALHPIRPDRGVPAGQHPEDASVLDPSFDRFDPARSAAAIERYDALQLAARTIALPIANVAAHEMGHAMGLVPNGPPPKGFFGGRPDVKFMGKNNTDSHHADYPGLNLMQAGGSFLTVIGDALEGIEVEGEPSLYRSFEIFMLENRLSAYSRGYLERTLSYAEF